MSKITKAYCRAYQGVFRGVSQLLDWTEPQLLKGAGSVKRLPSLIKGNGYKNVLVVTDAVLMKLGLLDGLFAGLKQKGIHYAVYDGTQPNPTFENVEAARELFVNHNCDAIVAFGGGSSMDCAKAAGARVSNPNQSIRQMKGTLKVHKRPPAIFAVPTTAGTGSETTIAAVVANHETHEKFAINDLKLRPGFAVLDPELTVGLPPFITATTGIDALTHAVEAYIGRSNTPDTIKAAEKAVKLIFANLEKAYVDGKDLAAREAMLIASYNAGLAFTRAYVGYVHAIAHKLGGMYNVPHGLANSVVLPYVLEFYGESAYEQLARLAEIAQLDTAGKTRTEKAKLFIEAIRELNRKMSIPDTIEKLDEVDIPEIALAALNEANPLYPVPKIMELSDVKELLVKLLPNKQ